MVLNDIINQAALRGSTDHPSRRASRKISSYLQSLDEDDEGPRLKERLTAALYRFIDIFCVWDCSNAYIRLAEVSYFFSRSSVIGFQHSSETCKFLEGLAFSRAALYSRHYFEA